ncbi:carboxylic acid transporter protein [Infundibulicybe gibba]|nr:carboxylic acid transporter protein [Infundibulicybe gibba]
MTPYFLRNLVPQREKRAAARPLLTVILSLTWMQWAHFLSGFLAWTCDAIDFYSVSLSIAALQDQFNKPVEDITTAITLTLLFRSVGAVLFGIFSDRYGRKWPLVFNLVLIAILELGVSFVQTFKQFLALRSLFGIGMGGIWGLASSTALENLPVEARGIASGILQQGYAVGCLLAAVINLTLVPATSAGWRSLFWTASGISLFAAFVHAAVPESEVFIRARAAEKARGTERNRKPESSSRKQRRWPGDIGPSGAFIGGAIAGYVSQYIGRRLTIIIFALLIGAFIPLWILPTSFSALIAGAFCIQFGVQGAWGVIPIQLAEMSPPAFRATFPGVAYQIGNMVSSLLPKLRPVQGILIGVVAAFVIIITIIGPENHGSHFEKHKTAFEEGAARDDALTEDDARILGDKDEEAGPSERKDGTSDHSG